MSSPRDVPYDIAETIIGFVALLNDDKRFSFLKNCALICRSFTEPSRYRLFRKIKLDFLPFDLKTASPELSKEDKLREVERNVELEGKDRYASFQKLIMSSPHIGHYIREFYVYSRYFILEPTFPALIGALPNIKKADLHFYRRFSFEI
ncbi:hypothetical protein BDQ17DRAFT_1438574 [Cyathus striatus]|nr:hypothetical protein BDQ17DRAFT_1438574 [Cyathus striatus]